MVFTLVIAAAIAGTFAWGATAGLQSPLWTRSTGRQTGVYFLAFSLSGPGFGDGIRLWAVWGKLVLLVGCLALPLASGCGGGNDANQNPPTAAAVARAFADARNSRDNAETCALYAENVLDQLTRGYGSCEAFYEHGVAPSGLSSHLSPVGIRVDGDRASGRLVTKKGSVTTSFHLTLVRENGEWRVSSFVY